MGGTEVAKTQNSSNTNFTDQSIKMYCTWGVGFINGIKNLAKNMFVYTNRPESKPKSV